jgi:hypothetical protein
MFALIEEAEQSKETITAFCAARDIKMKTFFYWRRKLLAARSAAPGFIPILPSAENTAVRLSYPDGVDLHKSRRRSYLNPPVTSSINKHQPTQENLG